MKTIEKRLLFFILLILFWGNLAYSSNEIISQTKDLRSNFIFIENKGQWDNSIKFAARTPNCNILISDEGIKFDYFQLDNKRGEDSNQPVVLKGQVISFDFIDKNPQTKAEGIEEDLPYFNFFKGKDPSKWASHCRTFKNVNINNIYQGIDIKLFFVDSRLRYDFIVRPDADVSSLKLSIQGANGVSSAEKGLSFDTRFGKISHGELFAFQNSEGSFKPVNCNFVNKDGVFTFNIGNYDKSKQLIIDPIVFSTFWGGTYADQIVDIKNIKYGEFVVCGWTESVDFKTTPGAYDELVKAGKDVFVSKFVLYESHNSLVFSTIVGSNGEDIPSSLALDVDSDIYLTGTTNSSGFPAQNGFSSIYQFETDGFVVKLSKDGTQLIYSSVFGGKKFDYPTGLVVTDDKSVYICGYTNSSDFPAIAGCYQVNIKGLYDAFALKISSSGKVLLFSTFLGGAGDDKAYGLDVDLVGSVYLTGETNSGDLPMAPFSTWGTMVLDHPFDYSYNGGKDAFIAKIASEGSRLELSTYFGGKSDDIGRAVLVDADQTVYFAGETVKESGSTTFPATDNVYSKLHKGGTDCFLGKMDKVKTSGTPPWTSKTQNLLFCTLFGGSNDERVTGMVRDATTNTIFMTGTTNSSGFPIVNSPSTKFQGKNDIFLTKFLSTGSDIVFSTLVGGKGDDIGGNLTIDSRYDVYVAGTCGSSEYKTINNQIQSNFGGVTDGLIFKYAIGDLKLLTPAGNEELCPNSSYDFKWATSDFKASDSFKIEVSRKSVTDWQVIGQNIIGNVYRWAIPDKYPPASDYIIRVSNKSGIFQVSDMSFAILEQPKLTEIKTNPQELKLCEGDKLIFTAVASGKEIKYQWYLNDQPISNANDSFLTIPAINKSGVYKLVVSGTCLPSVTSNDFVVTVNPATKVITQSKDTTVKKDDSISFTVNAKGINLSYEWFFGGLKILSAKDSVYTINSAGITHKGKYLCIVRGLCGEDSSFTFNLDVDTSTVISVKDYDIGLRMYPALVNGDIAELKISSDMVHRLTITIYNSFGQKFSEVENVIINQGQNIVSLPLKDIPQGMYWLVAGDSKIRAINKILIIR